MNATVHASAVFIEWDLNEYLGKRGILIRGPSGAGKSRLAFDLISGWRCRLVGDDRVTLSVEGGVLFVRPAPELRGLIEIRGLGIRRCDFEAEAPVGLVVDLAASDACRMPAKEALSTVIEGVVLPRIPVEAGFSALPLVLAELITAPLEPAVPLPLRRKV